MRISFWRSARSTLLAATFSLCMLASCEGASDATSDVMEAPAALALVRAPKIESVSMDGPGCPDAQLDAIGISGARDTFRIRFDAFAVSMQGDAGIAQSECTVSVVLDGLDGVAYAPAGITLAAATSSGATLSTTGYWTSAPHQTSEVVTTFPTGGAYLTGALNAPQLWSSCSGPRELRFTLKLSLGGERGRAEVERLSNMRFAARECAEADGAIDGGAGPLDASTLDAADAALADAQPEADAKGPDASSGASGPEAGPPPVAASAVVTNILTAGSACPASSAVITMPQGRDSFEIDFSRFALATSAAQTLGTSDCSVNLQVDVPEGQTVAIERFTLRGSASLPTGATARLTTYYSYVGVPKNSVSKVTALAGPFDGAFELAAEFVGGDLLFRHCGEPGRRLNIRLVLSIRAGEAGALAGASLEHLSGIRFVSRSCE